MPADAQHSIAGDVRGQFEHAWDMFAEAVRLFSAEQWRQDSGLVLAPARVAYHLLETAEYYLSDAPGAFRWGGRFGVDWESADAGALPTQEDILAYLGEVRRACQDWLNRRAAHGMLDLDPVYGGEGMSRLDRSLYLLRHTHHHIGELCAQLRRYDLPRPGWR